MGLGPADRRTSGPAGGERALPRGAPPADAAPPSPALDESAVPQHAAGPAPGDTAHLREGRVGLATLDAVTCRHVYCRRRRRSNTQRRRAPLPLHRALSACHSSPGSQPGWKCAREPPSSMPPFITQTMSTSLRLSTATSPTPRSPMETASTRPRPEGSLARSLHDAWRQLPSSQTRSGALRRARPSTMWRAGARPTSQSMKAAASW